MDYLDTLIQLVRLFYELQLDVLLILTCAYVVFYSNIYLWLASLSGLNRFCFAFPSRTL